MKWTKEVKVVLINALVGFIIGYVSFILNSPVVNFFIAVLVFAFLNYTVKNKLEIDEERNWWFGNSVVVFFFIWFIIWTLFYNLQFYGVL